MEARLEDDKIQLLLDKIEPISAAVCRLCSILAATTCSEIPCFLFVKPFLKQLRWTVLGTREEAVVDGFGLPRWPLEVFKAVFNQQSEAVTFGAHLFGLETLINQSLIGFKLCSDLWKLLDRNVLNLRSSHGQLVLSLDLELKSMLQALLSDGDHFDLSSEIYLLCSHCIPDPYAGPLWMFHHELLHDMVFGDLLPMLEIFNLEHFQRIFCDPSGEALDQQDLIKAKNNSEWVPPAERALLAYFSANIGDASAAYTWIKCHPELLMTDGESHPFGSLGTYILRLCELLTSTIQFLSGKESVKSEDSLLNTIERQTRELILTHIPYGHLAVLDLYRKLEHLSNGNKLSALRKALSTYVAETLGRKETVTELDEFLKAAIVKDSGNIGLPGANNSDNRSRSDEHVSLLSRQMTGNISALLGISFHRSHLRDFAGAIELLQIVDSLFRSRSYPGMQLVLITACELMHCYNAIGQEQNAKDVARSSVMTILRDPIVHHVLHNHSLTDTAAITRLWSLSFSEHGKDQRPLDAFMNQCEFCQTGPSAKQKDLALLDDGKSQSHSKHGSDSCRGERSDRCSRSSSMCTGISHKSERLSETAAITLTEANFEMFWDVQIILADSYIGVGLYDKALGALEAIRTESSTGQQRRHCLATLRLCKTLRREDRSPLDHPCGNDLLTAMSSGSSLSSTTVQSMLFDEFESTICQELSSSWRSSSLRTDMRTTLEKVQQNMSIDGHFNDLRRRLSTIKLQIGGCGSTLTEDSESVSGMADEEVLNDDTFKLGRTDSDTGASSEMWYSTRANVDSTRQKAIDELVERGYKLEDLIDPDYKALSSLLRQYVRTEDADIVLTLLEAGADVNLAGTYLETPLHLAIRSGRADIVRLLLTHGADVCAAGKYGQSSLHIAAIDSRYQIVKLLLAYGGNTRHIDGFGQTPLHLFCRWGDVRSIRLLLTHGGYADISDAYGQTSLHSAAIDGNSDVVRLLLFHGASAHKIDKRRLTPLHLAAAAGREAVVQLFIENGANINVVDEKDQTPLHLAAESGRREVTAVLLDHGADPHVHNVQGQTPLHLAARSGFEGVTKLLIARGADTDTIDHDGNVPLHLSAKYGDEKAVGLLLAHNASKQFIRNHDGDDPLHIAVVRGHEKVVEVLLAWTTNINVADASGQTPLHHAVMSGQQGIVELLLTHGANVDSMDSSGATAIDMVRTYTDTNFFTSRNRPLDTGIVRLLQRHGAKTKDSSIRQIIQTMTSRDRR